MKNYKIAVAGTGYVGLSLGVLLSQHHQVVAVDIVQAKVDICVLQRKDRKSIAITPCAAEHPMSFKVPDRLLTDGQCRMMINGIQFIQVLLEANNYNQEKNI